MASGNLKEYRRKRDLTKSPEPAGRKAPPRKQKLFFCVQKHLASHLHYDFRLEWDGVLMSWAVPKGPSLDPKIKRLAMKVEDHPRDYGTFEGVIPEGYGAGIVMLWDQGTWEPEVDVDAALKKGDLKFRLNGFKLKGSWVIVKTHGFGGAPNSWLLIKHKDDWAGPVNITEFAPLSVKTPDADFAEILSDKTPALWHSNAPAKGGDTGAMFKKIIERAMAMKAPAKQKATTKKAKNAKTNTKTKTSNTKAKVTPKPATKKK
jgi:bifunctional non-homologous end joining protein LigD